MRHPRSKAVLLYGGGVVGVIALHLATNGTLAGSTPTSSTTSTAADTWLSAMSTSHQWSRSSLDWKQICLG